MLIPKKIIDNSEITLADFLNDVLTAQPAGRFDIATAFFNLDAYAMVKENLKGLKRFRLLLGKAPEIRSDTTLGDELLKIIREEVEGYDLSKEKESQVKDFIEFLKRDEVEVRLYDEGFFHGKAYIFDSLVVIGSSNFTPAGLTHNTELNSVSLESEAEYTRKNWFEKFFSKARDFKEELINLLEASRFGSREYTPYEIYIKALYELQKEDIKAMNEEELKKEVAASRVNLAEFQEDAVKRALSRLKKYKGVLVADSVGLGKTWIAKRVIEEFGFYRRQKFLIVCPAQLRGMWRDELKDLILAESILSQEELAQEDFLEKVDQAVGGDLSYIALIVVDESHNFRNPLSNRWENLFVLVNDHISKDGKRPAILFLTATPINNTIWDLYWQMMLLTLMDKKAFIKEGISDFFKFFKDVDKKGEPGLLNDLLNEISIRRTRNYIKKNYPEAEVNGKKIKFPERILENIDYQLDESYKGMYRHISDIITNKLTMAYYKILSYKKAEKLSQEEKWALGRMMALEGIFRTILLKRLESSVEAFRRSLATHIKFLKRLKGYLDKGRLLTKKAFNKYVVNMDEESSEEFLEELTEFKIEDYGKEELFGDINKDITLFGEMLTSVSRIEPGGDAKLSVLKERILELAKSGQIVIFTYYADTLNYIYENIVSRPEFSSLRIERVSGTTPSSKRERLVQEFMDKKLHVLMTTDVLSEGMNLQSAQFVINYDLHWNPTRMIQRAGRIDRIGSPYKEIFVCNFFPEEELEDLLRLVRALQNKIRDIDKSIGLDQTILGEEVNPKVFGILRRIKEQDTSIFDELEEEVFGGGEKFYQPLRDFLKEKAVEELEGLPDGVYSGLKQGAIKGIFFYYKYAEDFHFWYLYDVSSGEMIKNKTNILDFIACPPDEERVIPDFFEKIYRINRTILEDIEGTYKEIELKEGIDKGRAEMSRDRSMKFVGSLVTEGDLLIDEYLFDFPEDKKLERNWEEIKDKLLKIPLTKKRLSELRKIWRSYKDKHKDWKKLMKDLDRFVEEKSIQDRPAPEPFNKGLLRLVVIDLIS